MTMGTFSQNLPAHPFAKLHHSPLVTGWAKVATLVPLRRDFRFASTQNPENIRDHSPHIGFGRNRYVEPHSPDSGRSRTADRDHKTHGPTQNVLHRPVQRCPCCP
jgi:hypothetical protein